MTLQPLTDDELPAAPVPHLTYFDAAVQSAIDGYTLSQLVDAQRQAAEAQRLKSEQEVARLVSENEAQAAEIARLQRALGEIAWSNDSKWQSDRADAALTGKEQQS